jgi:cellulose synthase/poly-beta-1,6-N-acetylglucosamine synthase-like glycosyltransferase
VPTIEGEFARKRRMMVGLWDIVVGEGMLLPRGYPPLFAFELFSHRLLRYATPFLHILVFLANLVLLGTGWFYYLTLILQLALLGVAALNAAAEQAAGEILAFSDANSVWSRDALRRLVAPFADPGVGYVCGQVRFLDPDGNNLEGAYWRYEMAVREAESALGGVTAGNGAIYAVRRDAFIPLAPSGSHDLSFPFRLAKRRLRSLYEPGARAEEKMVPTIEGEFARKRRMMVGLWDIVVGEGMLSPRGYPPLFAFEVASHRLLRYLSPLLHLVAFVANLFLLGDGWFYDLAFVLQLAFIAAALLGRAVPIGPFRIARYYLLTTGSIALGLWDRMRGGAGGRWEKAAGTR